VYNSKYRIKIAMKALTKKNLTEKQETFLEHLFDSGGDVVASLDAAGYYPTSRSNVMQSLREEIIARTKAKLATSTVKSARRLEEALDADGTLPAGQMEVRLKAAMDILDRAGISKKQDIEVKAEVIHGVVFLPPKQEEIVIEHGG
jgi:hypothetical protein